MEIGEIYEEDDFIIKLTIEGTSYEGVEVRVNDPNKTVREQISSIIDVFGLPKRDNGGYPIQYLLVQMMEDGVEFDVLELEDEYGREYALVDYNIQTDDHLHLISVPIPGTLWADLFYIKTFKVGFFSYKKLEQFADSPEHGFATSRYASANDAVFNICNKLNLGDPSGYYLTKVSKVGYKNIDLKYLEIFDKDYNRISLDDHFKEEDRILTKRPVLFLMPKSGISKSTYNKLKRIYNKKLYNRH